MRARGDSSSLVLELTGVCVGSVDLLVSVGMLCKFAQVQIAILTVSPFGLCCCCVQIEQVQMAILTVGIWLPLFSRKAPSPNRCINSIGIWRVLLCVRKTLKPFAVLTVSDLGSFCVC